MSARPSDPVATSFAPGCVAGPPSRASSLFAVIVVTSLGGLATTTWFPGDEEGFGHGAIVADRSAFWLVLMGGAVNLAVGLPALAVAGMQLAPERGSRLATIGGACLWIGAGLYAAGIANWAGMFLAATDPSLPEGASVALVAALNEDELVMWVAPGGGAAIVAFGTVLLSIGLLRARSLPRWVPVVAATSIVASFLVPTAGLTGLFVEGPIAVSSIGIGWYAWRRSRRAVQRSWSSSHSVRAA